MPQLTDILNPAAVAQLSDAEIVKFLSGITERDVAAVRDQLTRPVKIEAAMKLAAAQFNATIAYLDGCKDDPEKGVEEADVLARLAAKPEAVEADAVREGERI